MTGITGRKLVRRDQNKGHIEYVNKTHREEEEGRVSVDRHSSLLIHVATVISCHLLMSNYM